MNDSPTRYSEMLAYVCWQGYDNPDRSGSHLEHPGQLERKNAMRMLLMAAISAIGIAIVGTNDASALPVNATVIGDAASANSPISEAYYYRRYHRPYYRRYHRPYYGRHCWRGRYGVLHCGY